MVRVLREASKRVPELEDAFTQLGSRPEYEHLLNTRTNHRFLSNRLTTDMETQLKFILTQVTRLDNPNATLNLAYMP